MTPVGTVRPIEWAYFDPRTQAHGLCRYHAVCGFRAQKMVMSKRGWVLMCDMHVEKQRRKKEG